MPDGFFRDENHGVAGRLVGEVGAAVVPALAFRLSDAGEVEQAAVIEEAFGEKRFEVGRQLAVVIRGIHLRRENDLPGVGDNLHLVRLKLHRVVGRHGEGREDGDADEDEAEVAHDEAGDGHALATESPGGAFDPRKGQMAHDDSRDAGEPEREETENAAHEAADGEAGGAGGGLRQCRSAARKYGRRCGGRNGWRDELGKGLPLGHALLPAEVTALQFPGDKAAEHFFMIQGAELFSILADEVGHGW